MKGMGFVIISAIEAILQEPQTRQHKKTQRRQSLQAHQPSAQFPSLKIEGPQPFLPTRLLTVALEAASQIVHTQSRDSRQETHAQSRKCHTGQEASHDQVQQGTKGRGRIQSRSVLVQKDPQI